MTLPIFCASHERISLSPRGRARAHRALAAAVGLSIVGCIHDVAATAHTDAPVLVGPVHQIESTSPREASPLSPFRALLMNVKVSTGDEDDHEPDLRLNNQHMLDTAVSNATGGRERTFVALEGAQVKAMIFVVGWAFEKTTLNLFGTLSSQAGIEPAPASAPSTEPIPNTETP